MDRTCGIVVALVLALCLIIARLCKGNCHCKQNAQASRCKFRVSSHMWLLLRTLLKYGSCICCDHSRIDRSLSVAEPLWVECLRKVFLSLILYLPVFTFKLLVLTASYSKSIGNEWIGSFSFFTKGCIVTCQVLIRTPVIVLCITTSRTVILETQALVLSLPRLPMLIPCPGPQFTLWTYTLEQPVWIEIQSSPEKTEESINNIKTRFFTSFMMFFFYFYD